MSGGEEAKRPQTGGGFCITSRRPGVNPGVWSERLARHTHGGPPARAVVVRTRRAGGVLQMGGRGNKQLENIRVKHTSCRETQPLFEGDLRSYS